MRRNMGHKDISYTLKTISSNEKAFSRKKNDLSNSHIQLLNMLYREGKQRAALALTHENDELHSLEKLRIYIENSHYENAHQELTSLKQQLTMLSGAEKTELEMELLLEEARLHALNAQWELAQEKLTLLITLKPNAITLATALQSRANVYFERRLFNESMKDLESINSLAVIYPDLAVKLYSDVLKIKIQAHSSQRMLLQAKKSIQKLWDEHQKTPETALTILRLEISCLKLEKRNYLKQASACYWLAYHMGDLLYASLALIDIYTAISKEQQGELYTYLEFYLKLYPRAQIEFEANKHLCGNESVIDFNIFNSTSSLVLCDQNLIFHNTNSGIEYISLPKRDQLVEAINVLSQGPIFKDEFFKQCWKKRHFSLHLHDNLVRTLICRIRKETKINILSQSKSLVMSGVFAV